MLDQKSESQKNLILWSQSLPSDLSVSLSVLQKTWDSLELYSLVPLGKPELLRKGISFGLIQVIFRLLERKTDPRLPELTIEYPKLVTEIADAFEKLQPDIESNWLEECKGFGDKSAYHWEWKHFDSHELF